MTIEADCPKSSGLDDGRLIFAFAHDLRAHLRTVLTRVRLVQSAGLSIPDRENGFLTEAATAAKDIDGLVTAMVAYCSVTSKSDPTESDPMELSLLLRGLMIEVREALAKAEARAEITSQPEALVPANIKTVFRELILNACRFRRSELPARIEIALSVSGATDTEPGVLEAVISDNGIGVEEEFLEKIFEPFRRLHAQGEYPGYGLGLALCRRIIAINGGSIRASHSPAGGLSITFRIPLIPR
jgi:signal transduction histidine kinase